MSRSVREYLQHMLDETDYLLDQMRLLDQTMFLEDETRKRAFTRSLEIIGEAAKHIPEDVRHQYSSMVMLQPSGHSWSTGSPAAAIGDVSALVGVSSPMSVVARQSRGAAVAGQPVSAWRTHSAGSR